MYVCMYVCVLCLYVCVMCHVLLLVGVHMNLKSGNVYGSWKIRTCLNGRLYIYRKLFALLLLNLWYKFKLFLIAANISVGLCMYVCMYVCMHVFMNVCMYYYVCMYGCMYSMYACMNVCQCM